jgi:hypothetical protein
MASTRPSYPAPSGSSDYKAVVADMIKNNVSATDAFRLLREQLGNSGAVEKAFDLFKERLTYIRSKAQKFKDLIFSKYSTLPLSSLIEKAKKFKGKYELSDEEFSAFINLALNDKTYSSINQYNLPNTQLGKLFGEDGSASKMVVPTNELDVLQDILRLYAESSTLYEQIKLQSLSYVDCAPQALTGTYDQSKHNSYSYIHPVIAALFFPRIKYVDEHMLLSNIAYIVHCKNNGLPLRTLPDYEVYWDLRTDPNEMVCVGQNESPLVDIRNRVRLQIELWKVVRELREGRYYSDDFRRFDAAIDICKNNLFNDAEMANVKDEGTVLRKIFGAFALRPTVISISSTNSNIMAGNYSLNSMAAAQVSTIPIVNLRLPNNFINNVNAVALDSALEQHNWIVEGNAFMPKVTNIIYSRDVILFYANRRFQSVNFASLNAPHMFTRLPATHSSFETINEVIVNYNDTLTIGTDDFTLRSVVFVDKSLITNNLITGCSAGIVIRPDFNVGRIQATYFCYDPLNAGHRFEDDQGVLHRNPPLYEIPGATPFNNVGVLESFQDRATKRGTIYVFVKNVSQATDLRIN